MSIKLFVPKTSEEKQHPIFKMMLREEFGPEREVLEAWADGFEDRDGKFVKEFQTTFESSFWELYLFAILKTWGLPLNLRHHAPDFLIEGANPFVLEATIAAPPVEGNPAYGFSHYDLPEDFTDFNIESTLRICNSFDAKIKKYRTSYSNLEHVQNKPFVIGIASFDRPHSHFAAGRSIFAALYGLYHDEAATRPGDTQVTSYNVTAAPKNENVNIDVGLFCDGSYPEVSAVIYSSLATWGKVRALAENPHALTVYNTIHPNPGHIFPIVRNALKRDYHEELMDGLFVLHNPFAKHPIGRGVLAHPRLCEVVVAYDGELLMDAPEDFLLVRMLHSITTK
jgi:hypothetical protein